MLRFLKSEMLMSCVVLVIGGLAAWGVEATAPSAATQSGTTQPAIIVPAREARRKNPIPADEGSRATGKRIYAGNCEPCHNANGKGQGPVAHLLDLPPADLTDARYAKETDGTLYWKISNGHRPMPKFDNALPDESRWNVVNYLRTLIVVTATAPATEPSTRPKQ
ncbi:MAG: cytochrome c [Phycisphaerae bacterium]